MTIMRHSRPFAVAIATVAVAAAWGWPGPSSAQTPARTPTQVAGIGECSTLTNPFASELGPFALNLANPKSPLPDTIDAAIKSRIIASGLPCQDSLRPAGPEDSGLEDLQHGFDFFSWLSFIAWNSPADPTVTIDRSQSDMPTRWEDMDNFKQLLDVMLDPKLGPPQWPADKTEMEKEKVRLLPTACRALYKPGMMVVKMIEESYNEPFKTGPLIDQQGHYAIFDILMNRTMFKYISDNHLFTKAGQQSADNFKLAVDFPPGQNPVAAKPDATPPTAAVAGDIGAVMLKVSWKILGPDEIAAKNFHMVNALVSMPKVEGSKADPPCLPETLGLIGFHLVHKTASRPQWIWTSFEHVRNVPDKDEVAANKFSQDRYNFFAAKCSGPCPEVNATPPRPWTPDSALQLRFRKDDSAKSQIVRTVPLTPAARNMSTLFHIVLKDTVWENYMLLSTQWPSDFNCTNLKVDFQRQPDMTCSPAPAFLANSTLETYSQARDQRGVPPGDQGVPLATSSCIACHGNAVSFQKNPDPNAKPVAGQLRTNQSDFTFILEKAP
jgi:hypothetical protein